MGIGMSADRAAALRELAKSALGGFELIDPGFVLIKDDGHANFEVDSRSGRYLLRIHTAARRGRARVESELLWLEALHRDGFVDVPRPVRSTEGGLLVELSAEGAGAPPLASLITWLPGSHVVNPLRGGNQFQQVGRALGLLHDHGCRWEKPAGFERPSLGSASLFGEGGALGAVAQRAWERLDPRVRDGMEYAGARLREVEAKLAKDPRCFGLIHGDPTYGNLLFLPDRALIIDFDDCGWGHFAYDIGVALAGAWRRGSFAYDIERFVHGYRQVRRLSAVERSCLPVFMAARAGTLLLHAAADSAADGRIASEWQRIRFFLDL